MKRASLLSRPARLVIFALGLVLAGAGAARLSGGLSAFALAGAALLGASLCVLVASALTLRESPRRALWMLLPIPALLVLAWLGRGAFSRVGPGFAVGLLVLGVPAMGSVFLGSTDEGADEQG